MLDAVLNALEQLPSRPFRAVLIKSAGLALIILIVIGIVLDRALSLGLDRAERWLDAVGGTHLVVEILAYLLSFAAGIGLLAGAVLLMPAVTALVASLFVDEIADRVEERYYPTDPPGRPLPVASAVIVGLKAAVLSLAIYACALPLVLIAGFGVVVFFLAAAYLQGRLFFELVALRFHPAAVARELRREHRATVFAGGVCIALFLSIPIVGLAAPLFGTALMIHLYKRRVAESAGRRLTGALKPTSRPTGTDR
jgi:CysZ protein